MVLESPLTVGVAVREIELLIVIPVPHVDTHGPGIDGRIARGVVVKRDLRAQARSLRAHRGRRRVATGAGKTLWRQAEMVTIRVAADVGFHTVLQKVSTASFWVVNSDPP